MFHWEKTAGSAAALLLCGVVWAYIPEFDELDTDGNVSGHSRPFFPRPN